jgi:diadenosine tetraphosphate (Ap4A) HIT family hydrolase
MIDVPVDAPAVNPSARHRPLFATDRWAVLLYADDQTYVGRSVVFLRTRALVDPLDLVREERDELWLEVFPRLRDTLVAAFQPDRLNYAHLANRKHHVHWHVVPRYETRPRFEFAGVLFKDKRPGRIFRTAKRGRVSDDVLDAIAAHLRAHDPGAAPR